MTAKCATTEVDGRLLRHGILHGRELGYGTLRNSTQALATLLAIITWAQPIARERLDTAAAERAARWAGSRGHDSRGRRLDRRGFREAKNSCTVLGNLQESFYERHGHYAGAVDQIDPDGVLMDMFPGALTSASADRQTYMVWSATPAEYVFAVSGRNGEHGRWEYAGERPPDGGVGSDDDWRGPLDESHPDWAG
jgi:hypothetical protein